LADSVKGQPKKIGDIKNGRLGLRRLYSCRPKSVTAGLDCSVL